MSGYYDKSKIRETLKTDDIYNILEYWGGKPEKTSFGIVAHTICHNLPDVGSKKLYYYNNTGLFKCYTDCPENSFDIFELVIKVLRIQSDEELTLYEAMDYVVNFFHLDNFDVTSKQKSNTDDKVDWSFFKRHQIKTEVKDFQIAKLPIYDDAILKKFSYPIISNWEKEGIAREIYRQSNIGYYPGDNQITIPHYDINNNLIGIRGRALVQEFAETFGKYRPIKVNGIFYSHPLSLNLYNLNNSKDNIKKAKVAIIYEGEKATLLHRTIYGVENDISVAACGSNISNYQIDLLLSLGVNEIIIAFDRQFQSLYDDECKKLKTKLKSFYKKYNNKVKITAIFDKDMISPYKSSPIDNGKEIFEKLLSTRIEPK